MNLQHRWWWWWLWEGALAYFQTLTRRLEVTEREREKKKVRFWMIASHEKPSRGRLFFFLEVCAPFSEGVSKKRIARRVCHLMLVWLCERRGGFRRRASSSSTRDNDISA